MEPEQAGPSKRDSHFVIVIISEDSVLCKVGALSSYMNA